VSASGGLVKTIEGLARSGPDLSVEADLSVTVDDIDLEISTVENRIHVQVPSVRAGFGLLRRLHERLPAISQLLSEADLTAEILVGNSTVAVAGAQAAPGTVSNLVSNGQVEVRLRALVPAVLRLG
jgi:hypothetical protein